MSDDAKYDPDRMSFDDLDLRDPEVVPAYLDHPLTQAAHKDATEAFQRLPVEDK